MTTSQTHRHYMRNLTPINYAPDLAETIAVCVKYSIPENISGLWQLNARFSQTIIIQQSSTVAHVKGSWHSPVFG
jgi:hypothetical protein